MADLYELADRYHGQVVARDAKATGQLVRAYGQTWTKIRARLDALGAQIAAEERAGRKVALGWLFQRDRLNGLLRDVEAALHEFARFAENQVVNEQAHAVEAAQAHAAELVEASFSNGQRPAGVNVSFQRLPKAALQELVGFTSDGTPLRALFDELGPSASESVRTHLIQALGTGQGIKKAARPIQEDLGGNLVRALRIARTETLRAYRESSIRGFQANSDVVERWRWTASRSARTCAMCLAMDGKEFPVTEHFGSHVNCRCTPVPVVKSLAEIVGDPSIPDTRPKRDTGPEWFAKQPEATQLKILGPAKFAAYKDGKLKLEDLVGFREDPKWGPVRWERSLKDVRAAGLADDSDTPGGTPKPGTSGTGGGRPQIAAVEASIAPIKTHEVGVVFEPDGTEVFRKVGESRKVPFTPEEKARLADRVLTHNHPSGRSLSIDDVAYAVSANVQEMRATGINDLGEHHTYSLSRPEGGWGRTPEEVRNRLLGLDVEVSVDNWARVSAGEQTAEEADRDHAHERNLRATAEFGWKYERERVR